MLKKIERVDADFVDKINQLIDAVNELQVVKDVMFNRIDVLNTAICDMRNTTENVQPDAESRSENVQDKFAEQRKWVGCVCRFWYDNPDNTLLDYLDKIETGKNGIEYYGKETYDWFPNCKPVLPTDNAIYKGSDNE